MRQHVTLLLVAMQAVVLLWTRSSAALKVNLQWDLEPFSVACYTGVTVTQNDISNWDLIDWNDPSIDAVVKPKLSKCDHTADAKQHIYKLAILQGQIAHTRFSFPALKRQFRNDLLICPELGVGQRVDIDPDPANTNLLQPFKCEKTKTSAAVAVSAAEQI